MKELHCTKCGIKLNKTKANYLDWKKNSDRLPRYEADGEEIDYTCDLYTCPNNRWWSHHDEYVIR